MTKPVRILLIAALALSPLLWLAAGCDLNIELSPATGSGLDIVDEAWDVLRRDYVDREALDEASLSQGAIEGMVEALDDPYTSYLDPETYDMALTGFEGKYEGIGATVGIRDEQLMIIAPILGSPASQAGIRAGDIVLEIDGVSTEGMSLPEAVLIIRGEGGTAVRLLVLHQDETEPVEIEIVRAEIEPPSVAYEMREDIAYLHITHFSELTAEQIIPALEGIVEEGATAIVLDLRSNPGGMLIAVIDVASHFLTEGVVVTVVDNQGNYIDSSVEPKDITVDLPMVVLVDEYSSSGSEVLSGAFQDHGRAVIAGTVTFGKGSVNILRQLSDGSGLYVTTARWLTPHGRMIEGEGITPHYELDLEGDDAVQWAIDYLENR